MHCLIFTKISCTDHLEQLTASRAWHTVSAVFCHTPVPFQTNPLARYWVTRKVPKAVVPILAHSAAVGTEEILSTHDLEGGSECDPKASVESRDEGGRGRGREADLIDED